MQQQMVEELDRQYLFSDKQNQRVKECEFGMNV